MLKVLAAESVSEQGLKPLLSAAAVRVRQKSGLYSSLGALGALRIICVGQQRFFGDVKTHELDPRLAINRTGFNIQNVGCEIGLKWR